MRDRRLVEAFPRLLQIQRHDPGYIERLEEVQARAREFGELHARPRALEIDRRVGADHAYFDWEIVRAGMEYGLTTMFIPRLAGGTGAAGSAGADVEACVAMEELCSHCPGIATIFGAHGTGIAALMLLGGVGHWDGILAELVSVERERDEPQLVAGAVTEPSAGSDVWNPYLLRAAAITSEARRVDGGYELSGTKTFTSNGSVARWIFVEMPTNRRNPVETLTGFMVDSRSPGFTVNRVERKMGQRACPAAELSFDGVYVPDERVLGREGDGMAATLMFMALSRPVVGAVATGIARGAYERLLDWTEIAPEGAALREQQHFQLALAEIEMQIHLARQSYMDAALEVDLASVGRLVTHPLLRAVAHVPRAIRRRSRWQRLHGSPFMRRQVVRMVRSEVSARTVTRSLGLSSMAKTVGSDIAVQVTTLALELIGLRTGQVREELEKLWRDAKLTQIYEGTNQINMLETYRGVVSGETMAHTVPELDPKPVAA